MRCGFAVLSVLVLAQAPHQARAQTCADFVCTEYCVNNLDVVHTAGTQVHTDGSTCGADAAYVAAGKGTWQSPSVDCPATCTIKNYAEKCDTAAPVWDAAIASDCAAKSLPTDISGKTIEEAGALCCDDATYVVDRASCDVNDDGKENYRDFLVEYSGIVSAKDWRLLSKTEDHTCRCRYSVNPLNSVFTFDELQGGGVFLYLLGLAYMFLALAIVCDEFLVPALDCIIEATGVSNDVAGATFMAAGGSAPELFTSLVGTFQQSSVGFGTIVGSAVFNVLFVIGMCALFSKETLQLTWWPLARDCSYYALSLLVLAIFFGGIAHHPEPKLTDPDETWEGAAGSAVDGVRFKGDPDAETTAVFLWEAIVLFIMYIGYVLVMKSNEKLRNRFDHSVRPNHPRHRPSILQIKSPGFLNTGSHHNLIPKRVF